MSSVQMMQMRYTLGRRLVDDPYHVDIIKTKLRRTVAMVLPDIFDELKHTIPACIPNEGDGG